MNSLVSYNWLSEYVDLKGVTPEEFAARMSLSGPAIEKIHSLGADLENIVVGHVIDVKPHPNADKLKIAVVDVGKTSPPATLLRKERGIQIVCGGTNLKKDQWVAVALVGAQVRWHGEGDLIALEPTTIRGVKSEGMICAANEIGLFDAFPHAEREILDLGEHLPLTKGEAGRGLDAFPLANGEAAKGGQRGVKPGMPLADLLGLSSDVVMDVEVTSNRVDAMGMAGLAREAGAIMHLTSLPPLLCKERGSSPSRKGTTGELQVTISAKKHCPRYMAAKIEGVTVAPSPWWLKRRLLSAGLRPINNLVDISNYVMLELAQPTHVFDAAKIEKGIDVRLARAGEKMKALDGKEYQLDDSILVIADAKHPVAIAGVMGGEATSVTEATKDIILEVANFDPVTIRRSARKLNLQSDSQLRFEKGLSTAALPFAMSRMIELVKELAGGTLVAVTDVGATKYKPLKFSITSDEVNALIGTKLSQKEMVDVLRRFGFHVATGGKKITATVPWWRDHDIESGRDLVEEIARVVGYANLHGVVPFGLAPRRMDAELVWERRARDISRGAGLNEVYTYSFVPKELLAKSGYDASKMLRVQNPLSTDFEFMRTTLLPSLLAVAAENQERAVDQRCFEVANVYYPKTAENKKVVASQLPDEQLELGAIFVGMKDPWRHAKGYVEHLLAEMGIKELSWRRLSTDSFWHSGRTVQAFYRGDLVATIGEVSPKIAQNFKMDRQVALVDLPLGHVIRFASAAKCYTPLPAFPIAKRDLAILVDSRVEYDDVALTIRRADSRMSSVEWFDTYRGKNLPDGKKSIAMHLEFSALDRTLEAQDVDAMMEKIALALKEQFKAEIRG